MSEEKFLSLRKQMEENNDELKNYLHSMEKWRKDVQIKKNKLEAEPRDTKSVIPSIRNSLHKKRHKAHTEPKNSILKKDPSKKISGYDYTAWDKYNVDEAIKDIEKESEKSISSESETDEEWDNQRRIKLSEHEKEQGNLRFKEGRLAEAIEHYTAAIGYAPSCATFYANRALALLRMERYASAESDCSTALMIDPQSIKAYYRRSQCRRKLDKVSDAIDDLRKILDFDPNNETAIKSLQEISSFDVQYGNAVNRLINVSDIPVDEQMHPILINQVYQLNSTNTTTTKSASKPFVNELGDCGNTTRNMQSENKSIFIKSEQQILPNTPIQNPHTFVSPTNWIQLEQELRVLNRSANGLSQPAVDYLCSITACNYEKLIGQNLDSFCLAQFLNAISLSTQLNLNEKANRLCGLIQLPRFDVAALLLDDNHRRVAQGLVNSVKHLLEDKDYTAFINAFD